MTVKSILVLEVMFTIEHGSCLCFPAYVEAYCRCLGGWSSLSYQLSICFRAG
jgi:hypothetical protein